MGKLAEEALTVPERAFEPNHPKFAMSLNNLAAIYDCQGKYSEAEILYKRSLEIREKSLGPEHPYVATVCENLARLCRQIGKEDEAERVGAGSSRIRSSG